MNGVYDMLFWVRPGYGSLESTEGKGNGATGIFVFGKDKAAWSQCVPTGTLK